MSALSATVPPRLNWRTLTVYAVPALGAAGPMMYLQFYFLSFATDVLLLAPASVGAILAAGRVWDAITDPLTGSWSDRSHGPLGRRRIWMLAAAPASAISFAALWNPPQAWGTAGVTLWCGASIFAVTAALTAWSIPHQALGAEISLDVRGRSRVFGARFVASLVGVALAFAGMQLVINAADPRRMAGDLAAWVAMVVLILLLLPPLALRERPPSAADRVRPSRAPWRDAWRAVTHNRLARRVLFVSFAAQLATASQGVVAPYMAKYVLKRPDWVGVFPMFYIVPLVVSVPLWIWLAGRWGAHRAWRASLVGCSVSYLSLLALGPADVARAAVLLAIAGFWSGASGPLGPSLLAQAVDEDEALTQKRKDGVFFAAKEFVEKAGGAAVAVCIGVALQLSGYQPDAEQGPAALWAIRLSLAALPALMLAAAARALTAPHS